MLSIIQCLHRKLKIFIFVYLLVFVLVLSKQIKPKRESRISTYFISEFTFEFILIKSFGHFPIVFQLEALDIFQKM